MKWLLKLSKWKKKEGNPEMRPLPAKQDKFKSCDFPKCAVCQLSKQHRRSPRSDAATRPPGSKKGKQRKGKELMVADLKPGDKVSIDQYISAVPGPEAEEDDPGESDPEVVAAPTQPPSRTGRVRKPNSKYFGDDFANVAELGKKKIRHSALDQLMRPIAASTMEAEYNALAISMRDVLPLQELFKAILGHAVGIGKTFCTQFSVRR